MITGHKSYWVEQRLATGSWARVIGSEGNRSYALGWVHALDSYNPHPPYRLMCVHSDKTVELVEEFSERGRVKLR